MANAVKKSQLAQILAERMSVSKKDGAAWLDAFIEEVTKAMRRGDKDAILALAKRSKSKLPRNQDLLPVSF